MTVGKKGDLETLSQYGSASDGLGKVMTQGLPNAFALGGMQIIAAGQIRPDRTNTKTATSTAAFFIYTSLVWLTLQGRGFALIH